MAEIALREYRPEDAASFLRLHNSVFPPVSSDFWATWSAGPVTASVAIMDGEVVGAVPFHFRDFLLRPGNTIRVAFEYSVGVREDLRSAGVGSAVMARAKEFLRGRSLAMMVYRGAERSAGYRYYTRNGHHDMAYLRPWVRRGDPGVSVPAVERTSVESFLAREQDVLALFASAYAACGGYPRRQPGYYSAALQTNQYAEVPMAFAAFWHQTAGGPTPLLGYALVGEEAYTPALQLLEMATSGGDLGVALPLLAAFARQAAERQLPAVATLPDSSPYVPVLRALGFQPTPRAQDSLIIMAHLHDPEALAEAVWQENEGTEGLEVVAWTPEREAVLHRACGAHGRAIVLEMKEDALARLLLARLDLRAAAAHEIVTAIGAGPADIAAIASALPSAAWAYHHLDYI